MDRGDPQRPEFVPSPALEQYRREQAERQRKLDETNLLLENEVVIAGLAAADTRIEDYYRQLEAAGKSVHRLAEGVTVDSKRVVVAEYGDVPYPGAAPGGDWSTWHQTSNYSVFAFGLRDSMSPTYVAGLQERPVQSVEVLRGGGINITVEDPDSPDGLGYLHLPQRESDEATYQGEAVLNLDEQATDH